MEAGIDSRSAGQRKREDGMRSWQMLSSVFRSFHDAIDENLV